MASKRDTGTRVKMTKDELELVKANAKRNNFDSMSEYLRFLGTDIKLEIRREIIIK